MNTSHYAVWPNRMPKSLTVPESPLFDNLAVTAKRYPKKACLHYYGTTITYEEVLHEVEKLSSYLLHELQVQPRDRVILLMQNAPQYVIAFYAILRAQAVVVPLNPMNTTNELKFYLQDCESKTAIVGQELHEEISPLLKDTSLANIVVAAYSDYHASTDETLAPEVKSARMNFDDKQIHLWHDIMQTNLPVQPFEGQPDDMTVIPYTSGTTGLPKGCVHTNRTVQANVVSAANWLNTTTDSVHLSALPFFHVTGMLHSMHTPIYTGATMVILTRWNREHAVSFIEDYHCTHWINISTMVIDFLANPNLSDYDISSLSCIAGGGAALPEAVGEKLHRLTGLRFAEGYGLSETISHTHFNPIDCPKLQCLGVPAFNVDARVIDPSTLRELGPNEPGEIIVNGPQVFTGYYKRAKETEQAFIEMDGKAFFRTGDIGRFDEEGYYFMVDRMKRMINASGYKVWPTEVESLLYKHPAVEQACVVGIPDPKRGESVKAFIILSEEAKGKVEETEMIEWARTQMAAYKYPRSIEFRDAFPMTASGKILWRKLQDEARNTEEAVK